MTSATMRFDAHSLVHRFPNTFKDGMKMCWGGTGKRSDRDPISPTWALIRNVYKRVPAHRDCFLLRSRRDAFGAHC